MSDHLEKLVEAITALEGRLLLVVTGAGVSAASGIPTFRGSEPNAVWKVSDVELATFDYFQRNPVGQWSWYLERFERVESAKPNPAHQALVELERWHAGRGGRFQLVTQNIDTLHEQAGTHRLIKIHGTSARFRCAAANCERGAPTGSIDRGNVDLTAFRADPSEATVPRCPSCGGLLRAHVLFFDEYYQDHEDYSFDQAMDLARSAGLFLFVGTSFSVGITDLLLRVAAEGRVPAFSVDPAGVPPPQFPVIHLPAAAEDLLPQVAEMARERRSEI